MNNILTFHLINFSKEIQRPYKGPYKDGNVFYVFFTEIHKNLIGKVICETEPEIKALSNLMGFKNMQVLFGVAVILLALNGKW